ncbi:ferrous iron transport protein B [Helicobacter burdigaliensis]|uniref:ferrous iron transport protein B n=1 Tax=Helicobacter burdigaliensis TaxID=2315334 RepID=UPI000EF64101|nr:ferrous iron transport protein B [Helicobacter burdigaliensis]
MDKNIRVVLVGQPNVGKTLLINAMCNTQLKVGNFAGVTIQKSEAYVKYQDYEICIIDLPGTYSIYGYSQEEKITRDFLEKNDYDLIINVADSTNLERNLLLTTQLLDTKKKMILALNMSDEARIEGIKVDSKKLGGLLGIPCVSVSANTKENLDTLFELIISTYTNALQENKRIYSDSIEVEINKIIQFLDEKKDGAISKLHQTHREIAIALLRGDEMVYDYLHNKPIWMELSKVIQSSQENLYIAYNTKSSSEIFMQDLQAFSNGVIAESVSYGTKAKRNYTQLADNILINKYIGIPIFLFFMWLLFQATFTLGQYPMDFIENSFTALGEMVKANISSELIGSLVADGALAGVGAVASFLPNIIILFFGISLLETTGYMARVAFLLDGFFHKFGLHGKSFIPLVSGFGCSVPAFMAARTLKNPKDRLLTLFIINFMSCGARLPVYVLFVGAFFPSEQAGNWLFGIYILGALIGLVMAKILRMTVFKGDDEPFVMEMPKYRIPNWRLVWFSVYNKAKMYLKKAGSFILAASVLIWFATTFPMQDELEESYALKIEQTTDESQKQLLDFELQEQLIENSYMGQIGKAIEPFFAPIGLDWKLGVALVSGLAAKEVSISTMGVLYSLGGEVDEGSESLMEKIKANIPLSVGISFVLFTMIYNPCLAATIVFGKEAGGYRYILYLFLLTTATAYIVSFIGYTITKMLIA